MNHSGLSRLSDPELHSVWDQLGEMFRHRDDVIIAKMDRKNRIFRQRSNDRLPEQQKFWLVDKTNRVRDSLFTLIFEQPENVENKDLKGLLIRLRGFEVVGLVA